MNLRKHGVAGLAAALVIGLSGVTATSAAAVDEYATITGKVTYKNKPVVGASVYAQGTKGEWGSSATTDATGSYTMAWVDPGTYIVSVANDVYTDGKMSRFDFLQTFAGGTVRAPEAKKFTVAAGSSVTANINAIAGAVVKGKVVDAKGRPAKGVSVYASNTTRAGWGDATTDSKGNYRISGLATGKVSVSAYSANASGEKTVTAKQGSAKTAKTIKLKSQPLGTITGTVKGLKKTDSVWLYNTKSKYSFMIAAPGTKTFKVKQKVEPGTYRLVVGGTNKASKAVTVKAKKTSKAGTLTAPSKRTKVSGTVKGSNGKVLAEASVWVDDSYGTSAGTATTSAKGKYSISGVTSGKYTVSVYDSKNNNAQTVVKLTVKKGKNATKNVKMAKGYKVTGTVKYKSKAVAGVSITGTTAKGAYAWAETSSKGKFTLKGLGKGKVFLTAYDSYVGGYLTASKSATIKSKNIKWNVTLKK